MPEKYNGNRYQEQEKGRGKDKKHNGKEDIRGNSSGDEKRNKNRKETEDHLEVKGVIRIVEIDLTDLFQVGKKDVVAENLLVS